MKIRSFNIFRTLTLCTVAVIMIFAAVSCGGGYKNDVPLKTLTDAALAKVPVDGGYITADEDFMEFNFEGHEYAAEYGVFYAANTSANINELGVLRADSAENAQKLFEATEKYLEDRLESWMGAINYTPDEHPKMENAKCKLFGNYVVYTILTVEDRNAVIDAVESLLKN